MKIFLTAASAIILTATAASAQSLMFDFGPLTSASPYLTTSPGHSAGTIPLTDTAWNKISTSSAVSSLSYASGAAATGVTLTMGQESSAGNNTISYSTAITNTTFKGSGGGTSGQQSYLGATSIYGSANSDANTAVGRDGFFGGGTAAAGAAIGLRIDGLTAGDYVIYVMARNVSSNASALPMNIYTTVGASAGTFAFSSLTPVQQANTVYTTGAYAGQYNTFIDGNNYVAVSVSVATGQSLFLAIDGASVSESRAFLNAVQIVAVPEPSACAAGMLGFLAIATIVRRRKKSA